MLTFLLAEGGARSSCTCSTVGVVEVTSNCIRAGGWESWHWTTMPCNVMITVIIYKAYTQGQSWKGAFKFNAQIKSLVGSWHPQSQGTVCIPESESVMPWCDRAMCLKCLQTLFILRIEITVPHIYDTCTTVNIVLNSFKGLTGVDVYVAASGNSQAGDSLLFLSKENF